MWADCSLQSIRALLSPLCFPLSWPLLSALNRPHSLIMPAAVVAENFTSNVLTLKKSATLVFCHVCLQLEDGLRGTHVVRWGEKGDTIQLARAFEQTRTVNTAADATVSLPWHIIPCPGTISLTFTVEGSFMVSPVSSTFVTGQRQDLINRKRQKCCISQKMSLCFANCKMEEWVILMNFTVPCLSPSIFV